MMEKRLRTTGLSNAAGMSRFGELARHSGLGEFHSCALRRQASQRELIAKIPSLPLALGIAFSAITQD